MINKKTLNLILLIVVIIPVIILAIVKGNQNSKFAVEAKNEKYTSILSIEGEFRYTAQTVEVIELKVDERRLLMDVILYNEFHPGEILTKEQYQLGTVNQASLEQVEEAARYAARLWHEEIRR